MSTEDKVFIEHKINAVCGGKLGAVHPEFFLAEKSGAKILQIPYRINGIKTFISIV